jgi:hypothetical protein
MQTYPPLLYRTGLRLLLPELSTRAKKAQDIATFRLIYILATLRLEIDMAKVLDGVVVANSWCPLRISGCDCKMLALDRRRANEDI